MSHPAIQTIELCPEYLGGLATPRPPAERVGGRVLCEGGLDVTREFETGAQAACDELRARGCLLAILKSKSPSCGTFERYDGSFTSRLITGEGITAQRFAADGIAVIDEFMIEALVNGSVSLGMTWEDQQARLDLSYQFDELWLERLRRVAPDDAGGQSELLGARAHRLSEFVARLFVELMAEHGGLSTPALAASWLKQQDSGVHRVSSWGVTFSDLLVDGDTLSQTVLVRGEPLLADERRDNFMSDLAAMLVNTTINS